MSRKLEFDEDMTLEDVQELVKEEYYAIDDSEDRVNFLRAIVHSMSYTEEQHLKKFILEGGRFFKGDYLPHLENEKSAFGLEDVDIVSYFLTDTNEMLEDRNSIELLMYDSMHKMPLSHLTSEDVEFLQAFKRACEYVGGLPTSYYLNAKELARQIDEVLDDGYWLNDRYRYDEDSMAYSHIRNVNIVRTKELQEIKEKQTLSNLDKKKIMEVYKDECFKRGILPLYGAENSEVFKTMGLIDSNLTEENYREILDLTLEYMEFIPVRPFNVTGRMYLPVAMNYIDDWRLFLLNSPTDLSLAREIVQKDLKVKELEKESPLQYCLKNNIAPMMMAKLTSEDVYLGLYTRFKHDKVLALYLKEILKCYKYLNIRGENLKVTPFELYDVNDSSYTGLYNLHGEILRLSDLKYASISGLIEDIVDEFCLIAGSFRNDLDYKTSVRQTVDKCEDCTAESCRESLVILDKFLRELLRGEK